MLLIDTHPLKALDPIATTLSGMETLTRLVHSENELNGIEVEELGISTCPSRSGSIMQEAVVLEINDINETKRLILR